MIYVGQLCAHPTAPCKALKAFKRKHLGAKKPDLDKKPGAGFFVISVCLGLVQLYRCSNALGFTEHECNADADSTVLLGLRNFVYIQIAWAILDICFAGYLLFRLWPKILAARKLPGFEAEHLGPSPDGKYLMIRVPNHTVQKGAKDFFMYDWGVFMYFLASLAVMILSFMAPNAITHATECPHAAEVRSMGISIFWFAVVYTPLWFCCCTWPVVGEVPLTEAEHGDAAKIPYGKSSA